MITSLGFLSLKNYWEPDAGEIAPFGELSTESQTHERSISKLNHALSANRYLTVFNTKDDAGKQVDLPSDDLSHIWVILDWVANEIENGRTTSNARDFHVAISNQFSSVASNFEIDAMVNGSNKYAPTYVKWKHATSGNQYQYWLSDSAFQNQYPEGEVVVVPKIPRTSTWFLSKSDVENAINQQTQTSIIQDLNKLCVRADGTAAAYTSISPLFVRWYDKDDSQSVLDIEWTVAIYGKAKNNPEDIKAAIRRYLLDSGNYTDADWIPIFPEIFNPTEFMLVPLWAHEATAPSKATAIFQPMVRLELTLNLMKTIAPDYTDAHVTEHTVLVPNVHESISMLSCSSPNNQTKKFRLFNYFDDYFLVNSKSPDWSRVSKDTQDFINLLHTMLHYAKVATGSTVLPSELFRVYRQNRMYIVGKVGELTLLMMSRVSYLAEFGDINNTPHKSSLTIEE